MHGKAIKSKYQGLTGKYSVLASCSNKLFLSSLYVCCIIILTSDLFVNHDDLMTLLCCYNKGMFFLFDFSDKTITGIVDDTFVYKNGIASDPQPSSYQRKV